MALWWLSLNVNGLDFLFCNRERSEQAPDSDFLRWIKTCWYWLVPCKQILICLCWAYRSWLSVKKHATVCDGWYCCSTVSVLCVTTAGEWVSPHLWNKTPLSSTPTFTHFQIKQLSGCPGWPLREYCKPSSHSILPQSRRLSWKPCPLESLHIHSQAPALTKQYVWIEIGDG